MALAFAFLLVIVAHATEWYSARNLGEQTKSDLIAKSCFRGSYGINQDLSLFNCLVEGLDVQPFAILPETSLLCVIEMKHRENVLSKLQLHNNVMVVHETENEVIIGNVDAADDGYPTLCAPRSNFGGDAWNVIVVPMMPMAKPLPVKESAPEDLAPNAAISELLSRVSASSLMSFVNQLSNVYNTRLSTTANATAAVNWAAQRFRDYGLSVTTQAFRTGYCSNIIATKTGSVTTSTVVIGAHIDSRSESLSNTTAPAPGADDDGSGFAALLELARVLQLTTSLRLNYNLVLAGFCGEEQGLYGSQYMANDFSSKRTNIIGMYNADMIAYRCGTTTTLTFDSRGVNTALTNQCKAVVPDYQTTYQMGTNSGCCSDNQSFENAGYPTVSFFECPGTTVANPNYHKQSDRNTTLNQDQLVYVSKALYACALTQARPL